MRIILFTGKGGVGKTTVAVATALHLADKGHRVLTMSTDPAHSLGDALETPLTGTPTVVAPGLKAMEIDALTENDRAWARLRDYLGRLLTRGGEVSLATEEALLLPGLGELFSLLQILDHASNDQHDVLVVDCAPTGETMSLLKYPERLDQLFRTALPTKRALVRVLGRPFEKLTRIPMPEDHLFDDLLTLTERLKQLGELLHDGEVTTLRLVTTPERVVVEETRRAHTWLTMYGFVVDGVVVNRIHPPSALSGYFAPWAEPQTAGIQRVTESFGHLPIHRLPLQTREVARLAALRDLARQLYGDDDPSAVQHRGDHLRVTRTDGVLRLHLNLPHAVRDELELQQDEGDLLLSHRGQHRRIAMPDSLTGHQVTSARFHNNELILTLD
ncbi:MAG: ArsA family ATPase [Propionibacteriaceae bacterium]|nr:ArsA family ATPase [Propionibacteriaceae bacterium]